MSAKVALIYLSTIIVCTVAGFLAGECVKNVEGSFLAHQKQMYYGSFPGKMRGFDQMRWQEMHELQLQLITLGTSIGGFLLGATLVSRNAATPIANTSELFTTKPHSIKITTA